MIYSGPMIDPHHHLWDLSMKKHPWLEAARGGESVHGDLTPLLRDYLPRDLRAEGRAHHLVASVHVEAGWDPADPVGETRWLDGIADAYGLPTALVVAAPLHKPEAPAVLEAQCAFARVRGIRFILSWHEDPKKRFAARPDIMQDPAWLANFALLERHGLSFDLMLYPGQMADAAALAARFPNVQFVVNHGGSPIDRDEEAMKRWRRGLHLLGGQPNVAIKISDLVAYDHDWTLASLRPVVLSCIEAFGTERAMFGSDAPVMSLWASYDEVFSTFKTIVADFSPDEQRALFHDNAARVYRLEV